MQVAEDGLLELPAVPLVVGPQGVSQWLLEQQVWLQQQPV